jgi:uncharacterized protein
MAGVDVQVRIAGGGGSGVGHTTRGVARRATGSSRSVARFRRRYDPYDEYDPDDPRRARRWGPPRRYYGPARGSSCLRDACLLETGCCVAESLDGNCLVLTLLAGPQLAAVLLGGVRDNASGGRSVADRLVGAVRLYQQRVSARRPPVCRFTPSCSEYAVQAVQAHGAARGAVLALRRLVRCRPGGRRGADPVPRPGGRPRWAGRCRTPAARSRACTYRRTC